MTGGRRGSDIAGLLSVTSPPSKLVNAHSIASPPHRPKPVERQPLLWAVLAYAAGILFGTYAWRPFVWWLAAIFVFVASAGCLRRHRVGTAFLIACAALFTVGAVTIQLCPSTRAMTCSGMDGQDVIITGHVTREGDLRHKTVTEIQQQLDLETEQLAIASGVLNSHCGIRATIYGKNDPRDREAIRFFRYGERRRFPTKLSRPRNFHNSGSFDYEGYLAEQGITALASTKAENVEVLSGFVGRDAELWRTRVYHRLVEQTHRLWQGEQPALMDAMLAIRSLIWVANFC